MSDDEGEFDVEAHLDDLREAIEDIPHGDPEAVTLYNSGQGHFVIEAELDDDAFSEGWPEIDDPLEEAGFQPDGILKAPGMTQQNVVHESVAEESADE